MSPEGGRRSSQNLSQREKALKDIGGDIGVARSQKEHPAGYWSDRANAKIEFAKVLGIVTEEDVARMERRLKGETKHPQLEIDYYYSRDGLAFAVRGAKVAAFRWQADHTRRLVRMTLKRFEREIGCPVKGNYDQMSLDRLRDEDISDLRTALTPRTRKAK